MKANSGWAFPADCLSFLDRMPASITHGDRRGTAGGFSACSMVDRYDQDMTLIIAAKATDGVVVVADTREASLDALGWYRDDVKKTISLGACILSAAGPAQWLRALADTDAASGWRDLPAREVASHVHHALVTRDWLFFPDMTIVIAGAKPKPELWWTKRQPIQGTPMFARPIPSPEPYLCFGVQSPVATSMLKDRWREDIDVKDLAATCVAAVQATAEECYFVSPSVSIDVLRTDGAKWSDDDRVAAEAQAGKLRTRR